MTRNIIQSVRATALADMPVNLPPDSAMHLCDMAECGTKYVELIDGIDGIIQDARRTRRILIAMLIVQIVIALYVGAR